MGIFNIWNTNNTNKASLTFTGSSDKTVDTNTVLQSTDSTASIANGKVVVDSSGNVGVGVTPSSTHSATTNIFIGNGVISAQPLNTSLLEFIGNAYYSPTSGFLYKNNNYAENYYMYNGGHYWRTAPSGTAGNTITWTTAMTLDASSNLAVAGNITSAGNTVVTSANVGSYALADTAHSFSGNGYQKLSNGLIIQWGTITTVANGGVGVTFPIAFPNTCASAVATGNFAGADYSYNITSRSTTQMTLFHQGGSCTSLWIAIGY